MDDDDDEAPGMVIHDMAGVDLEEVEMNKDEVAAIEMEEQTTKDDEASLPTVAIESVML